MASYEEGIRKILKERMQAIKDGITRRMAEEKRTVTGRSVNSLAIVMQSNTSAYLEGDAQWKTMQKGRAPGKGPHNFREIIEKWIDDRGISVVPKGNQTNEAAKRTLAFLITRSILKKGTALYRDHKSNNIYDSVVEEELKNMQVEAGAFFELATDKINDRFIYDYKDDK